MRLITVVQARMTSARLPGKTLATVGGLPLLGWVFHRLSLSDIGGPVIVATSDHPSDKPIVEWCERTGVVYYRGSLVDVLDRYHTLAHRFHADAVLRVTADCPLLSPTLVNVIRDVFDKGGFDYVGDDTTMMAEGLTQEIIGTEALDDAWLYATGADREHVITFTVSRPDEYVVELVRHSAAESRQRFSIDTPADLERLRGWYERRPDLFDLDIPELLDACA